MNEQEFQSQATPTAFQLYYNRIRSVFASPLFLALTIAVTCMAFFQLIATMSNGVGIATLMNLLYLAMETLTAIGCWLTWYQARSNADAPTHLGMTRCYPTMLLVMYYIVAVLVGLVGLILIASADLVINALKEATASPSMGLPSAEAAEIRSLIQEFGDSLTTILIVAFLIIVTFMVLMIIRSTKLLGIIKRVEESFTTGRVPHLKTGFYCVMTYICVGFGALGLVLSLLSADGLSIISSATSIAVMLLPAIIISRAKYDLKRLEALEKAERSL